MSEGRSGKSHATAWTVSILAILLLYVVTLPPLASLVMGDHLITGVPRWLKLYCIPAAAMCRFPRFAEAFYDYGDWWEARLHAVTLGHPWRWPLRE